MGCSVPKLGGNQPWLVAAILAVALPPVTRAADKDAPCVFQFAGKDLVEVKCRLAGKDARLAASLQVLIKEADRQIHAGPFSVMAKPAAPPGGTKHDYTSLAPFWWPDPMKKDGLPFIRRDGQTNPATRKYDKPQLEELSICVHTLALAYFLTGEERYAARAALLLRTWFLDPATRMTPHLEFAQFIPGKNKGRGAGIIDGNHLLPLIDAVGLLEKSRAWKPADQQGMVAWFKDYLHWLKTSKPGQTERAARNNHGSWIDVQLANCALFTGDDAFARQVLNEARQRRIAAQIEPDGKQPLELARTKGLDYCRFNLEALFALASLGQRFGIDLWHFQGDKGQSIRKAIDWAAPYAAGEKKWPAQQIVTPKLARYVVLLRRAARAYKDGRYENLATRIAGDSHSTIHLLLYP